MEHQFKGMTRVQSNRFLDEDQEIEAKTKKSLDPEMCPREDRTDSGNVKKLV